VCGLYHTTKTAKNKKGDITYVAHVDITAICCESNTFLFLQF